MNSLRSLKTSMHNIRKIILLLPLIFLTACIHTVDPSSLNKLRIGMSKEQVADKFGNEGAIRSSQISEDGSIYEVIEYSVDFEPFFTWRPTGNDIRHYWLEFRDDKLVSWHQAGDFQPSHVQEIRYR